MEINIMIWTLLSLNCCFELNTNFNQHFFYIHREYQMSVGAILNLLTELNKSIFLHFSTFVTKFSDGRTDGWQQMRRQLLVK